MGWDEAFLGAHTDDPEALAGAVQRAVLAGTGLSCSVGIGDNLLRAKIATEFGKPAGGFRLTAANWDEVMGDRPDPGAVGHRRQDRAQAGRAAACTPVRELAAADPAALAAELGPTLGPWYVQLGRGHRPGAGAGHAVGAALAQPRDDLPAEPHRAGTRCGPGWPSWPGRWPRTCRPRAGRRRGWR